MNNLSTNPTEMQTEAPPKMSLFDFQQDKHALENLTHEYLLSTGGDMSDEQVDGIIDEFLRETTGNINAKIDGYCGLIRSKMARVELRRGMMKPFADEAARYNDLAKTDEAFAKRLKARLLEYFHEEGIAKHETDHFKLAVAGNGGKAPLVIFGDVTPDEVAECYTTREFNTERIRESLELYETALAVYETALNSGVEVGMLPAPIAPECLKFAALGARGTNLRIK